MCGFLKVTVRINNVFYVVTTQLYLSGAVTIAQHRILFPQGGIRLGEKNRREGTTARRA
jgi:hypothetical protein